MYATAGMSAAHEPVLADTSVTTVVGLRRKLNKRAGGMSNMKTESVDSARSYVAYGMV